MQATFCSLYLDELASLKAASLYFDKIVVPADGGVIGPVKFQDGARPPRAGDRGQLTVAATYWTRPKQVEKALQPLVDEGIVIFPEPSDFDSDLNATFQHAFEKEVRGHRKDAEGRVFVEINQDLFMARPDELDLNMVGVVYAGVLRSAFLESVSYDSPILTDNPTLDKLLSQFIKRNSVRMPKLAKAKTGYLAHRVLLEMLPSAGDAEIDDLLEVRSRLKDDLGAFRTAMSKLSGSIRSHPWSHEIEEEVDKIVETQVRPKVADLNKSLRMANLKLGKNLLHNLRNPTSYIPFTGTVLGHMEPTLAALATAGVVGFRSLYDAYLERRKIKDASGLTFLLKASKTLSQNN
jgi:hypothetical protein